MSGEAPLDATREWVGADYARAFDVVDAVKDAIASGRAPSADIGAAVVETFGFRSSVVMRLAREYVRDEGAQIREWGGDADDVARTCLIDGMMLGVALALTAADGRA